MGGFHLHRCLLEEGFLGQEYMLEMEEVMKTFAS